MRSLPALLLSLAPALVLALAVDNQTMTAVLDSRRAMLSETNKTEPEDTEGQGDGDSEGHIQHAPGLGQGQGQGQGEAEGAAEADLQEDRALSHHHMHFSPMSPLQDQRSAGYEAPTRHIHIHQHHVGTVLPVHALGLSHYRAGANTAPSAPAALSAQPFRFEGGHHQHEHHEGYVSKDQLEHQHAVGYVAKDQPEHHHAGGYVAKDQVEHHGGGYVTKDQLEHHAVGYVTKDQVDHHGGGYVAKDQLEDHGEEYASKDQLEHHHGGGYITKVQAEHHGGGYVAKDQLEHHGDGYAAKDQLDPYGGYLHKNQQEHHGGYVLKDQDGHGVYQRGHGQQYSVHEDQEHEQHSQQAEHVHSAIAASHPVAAEAPHPGELAVLSYPLMGPAPYDSPKATLPDTFIVSHKPKHLHKSKSGHSLWHSALRVVAGLAPIALLAAALQPNVLIIDPRLGTRQRSGSAGGGNMGNQSQLLCERRAVCEAARASGPLALQRLHALMLSTPPATAHAIDLQAVRKAVEANDCSLFVCDQFPKVGGLPLQLPRSAAATATAAPGGTSSGTGIGTGSSTAPKERKRKKVRREKHKQDAKSKATLDSAPEKPLK